MRKKESDRAKGGSVMYKERQEKKTKVKRRGAGRGSQKEQGQSSGFLRYEEGNRNQGQGGGLAVTNREGGQKNESYMVVIKN